MTIITSAPLRRPAALLACGAWLALAGCATPLSYDAVEDKLRSAARSVTGLGQRYVVVPVHADSRVAAWTLMAEAKSDGGTLMARRLSADLKRGERRRFGVVVGGIYPDLTREVVLGAFEQLDGRPVPGLTLVYVGDPGHARELRAAAKSHRARFYHRELP